MDGSLARLRERVGERVFELSQLPKNAPGTMEDAGSNG